MYQGPGAGMCSVGLGRTNEAKGRDTGVLPRVAVKGRAVPCLERFGRCVRQGDSPGFCLVLPKSCHQFYNNIFPPNSPIKQKQYKNTKAKITLQSVVDKDIFLFKECYGFPPTHHLHCLPLAIY